MKKTQYWFLFLALLGMLASCNEPKDRVRIVGEISGIKLADFYVYNEDGLSNGVDTVKIQGGEFRYEREISQPVILTFLYPNFSRTYVVAEPGKKLKVKGSASKLSSIDVSGSEDNEMLTKFRQQNAGKPEKEVQMAAAQYVRDHEESMSAVAVFKRYFVQAQKHNAAVALPLLELLRKAQPTNQSISVMYDQLISEMQTAEGNSLPNFQAVTVAGDTITQDDFMDKPSLFMFWASWNTDCYQLLKKFARLESRYHDRVNFLGISLDYEKKLAKIRFQQEGINGPLICEERGFASPIVKTLGMRYVPGNLLVGKDGEIVARDLPLDKLEEEIKDLIE